MCLVLKPSYPKVCHVPLEYLDRLQHAGIIVSGYEYCQETGTACDIRVNVELEEIGRIGDRVIVRVHPRGDEEDFSDPYVFVFAQVAHKETATAAMAYQDSVTMQIESFKFSFPFSISWTIWEWRLDSYGMDISEN